MARREYISFDERRANGTNPIADDSLLNGPRQHNPDSAGLRKGAYPRLAISDINPYSARRARVCENERPGGEFRV